MTDGPMTTADGAASAVVAAVPETDLARSTATMTALTMTSRLAGLVRIAVVTAVLGDTFLGNTYQSANTVPNLLFELIAAGALQATLIPTIVELLARGEEREAEHVARSVLGLAGAALAVLAGLGMLAAPQVMRLLVSAVDDPAVRQAEVRLGTVLLWCFLPQVVFYASHMVSTAMLHARGRFAAPAFAPLLNNVVVTASYIWFWRLRGDAAPSLDLTLTEKLVLGLGTTAGVLAFCAVPVVAALRQGLSLRPRFDLHHPVVRVVARRGSWAALFLAVTQILQGVVLVLANRVEGGVVAWTLAFTVFLLPHALVSLPVTTALYPAMSAHAVRGDEAAYGRTVGAGLRSIGFLVLPAAAGMVVLSRPLADLLRFGEFGAGGADQVAAAVRAFGPGLVGYGAFLFLARALYARGDTRTPALVNLVVVAVGSVAMATGFDALHGHARVAGLAAGHSLAYLGGAVALYVIVHRRSPSMDTSVVARAVGGAAAAAAVAAGAMWIARMPFHGHGRPLALAEVGTAGIAGLAVYVLTSRLVGGPRLSAVPSVLRGDDG